MICPHCKHDQSGVYYCDICQKPIQSEQVILTDEQIEEARREGQDIHISIHMPPMQQDKEEGLSFIGTVVWLLIGAFIFFPLLVLLIVILLMIIF